MINLEYKIGRYEALPPKNPTSLIVRFVITDLDSGNFQFFEKSVPIEQTINKSQNEICQKIFAESKKEIKKVIEELEKLQTNIVGHIFLPHE